MNTNERDGAALSLRPADAAGVESVSADFAALGGVGEWVFDGDEVWGMSMLVVLALASAVAVKVEAMPFSCRLLDQDGGISVLRGSVESFIVPSGKPVNVENLISLRVNIVEDSGNLFLLANLPGEKPTVAGSYDGASYVFDHVRLTTFSSNTGYATVTYFTPGIHSYDGFISTDRAGPCKIGPRAK